MIKGVPKYADLHVSRISPEISKEVLYQLPKEEFPEIKCETLNSKNADDWLQIFSSSDFQQAFQSFYSSLLYYFGISFPKRKSFAKPDKKNWINNDVIKSSRYLKDLFVMKNNYPELVPAYEQVKRKHSGLVKRTKQGFYRERIMSSSDNIKYLWKVVSELTQKNTSKVIFKSNSMKIVLWSDILSKTQQQPLL
nr:unnamed protein product [Callosobruchus analis]